MMCEADEQQVATISQCSSSSSKAYIKLQQGHGNSLHRTRDRNTNLALQQQQQKGVAHMPWLPAAEIKRRCHPTGAAFALAMAEAPHTTATFGDHFPKMACSINIQHTLEQPQRVCGLCQPACKACINMNPPLR